MQNSILLVEDDPRDLELTLIALKRNDFGDDVAVVQDGEQALDYLFRRGGFANRDAGNPSLIILDIKTPNLSGLQVLEVIRESDVTRTIPVVILTNSQSVSDLQKAYDLHVNSFIIKPLGLDDFVEAVSKLGIFWGELNSPPIGSIPISAHVR